MSKRINEKNSTLGLAITASGHCESPRSALKRYSRKSVPRKGRTIRWFQIRRYPFGRSRDSSRCGAAKLSVASIGYSENTST
jgi:hypothetical protein